MRLLKKKVCGESIFPFITSPNLLNQFRLNLVGLLDIYIMYITKSQPTFRSDITAAHFENQM